MSPSEQRASLEREVAEAIWDTYRLRSIDASETVKGSSWARLVEAATTPGEGSAACRDTMDLGLREARAAIAIVVRRCAEVASSVGRPVGAGDGDTYVPGTSVDAARAIRALAGEG